MVNNVAAPRRNQSLPRSAKVDEVIIAGCGVAGCFLALRLLQLGLKPTLLRLPTPTVGGVEIIPASAGRLLDALDLGDVLAGLGAGLGDGLTRRRADETIDLAPGRSLHVDRVKFRDGLLAEAARRGARIRDVKRLPPPDPMIHSVDATGQRAVWSRPVVRLSRRAADIFVAEAAVAPGTGRLALLDQGWAYLAADQSLATVGVVGRNTGAPTVLDTETRQALGLAPNMPFRFLGRRPALVQWARAPVVGRRLAIGDAAFHHDPIGGRGISFALGSAFAAAAVLATWRDDPSAEANARSYYDGYVASEVRRHLAFLGGEVDPLPALTELPERLQWIAPAATGALVVGARVVSGEVFMLASGQPTRWAGGLDLARLRELIIKAQPTAAVAERLRAHGLTAAEARSALVWAFAHRLIAPAGSRD
jgi:hypothetical protein